MPDFSKAEFAARARRASDLMAAAGIDALLFTTEAEIRYFTGFRTLFWQSPARPWFLILPRDGAPVAVIPEIGAELMGKTWIGDIRTWPSPRPEDEGISILIDLLARFGRIGMPMGEESALRMGLGDFRRLSGALAGEFVDATPLVRTLRMVKSPAEIAILARICRIGSDAFDRAQSLFSEGQTLFEAFRDFRIALLQAGAEDVPYLVGGAGQGGYGDVISPPSSRRLRSGDVLMLDTGATERGYFCDFDRNFAIGHASGAVSAAYRALFAATEAGLAAAKPGARASDLHRAMAGELPRAGGSVGRFGHGLGMQLTEWPSIAPEDGTRLQAGMVLTLEPSMPIARGKMMVHEENIVITETSAKLLTRRAAPEIPVI